MKLFLASVAIAIITIPLQAADKPAMDNRLFEMRIYTAAPGKLDALNARFKNHTIKLFEKHGMVNIGYWVPIDNADNKLYYVIAHKDRAARDASFKAFAADPAWKEAAAASEKDGKLVTKIEQHFLTATDFSPAIKLGAGAKDRVFELRIYTATEGNLEALNSRFRDHTVKLFTKHGMTNFCYWNLAKGEKNADKMLIYLLAHDSVEAAKKSFDAFRLDPDWLAARTASEKKAGGSLTAAKDGVVSIFMKATDYSQTK